MNLQETIRRILKEETEGINLFMNQIESKFQISDELRDFLIDFINRSDCKNIEFANFKMGVLGIALHTGVLINKNILNSNLESLLFVIFHEIAHQYQFKKYGEDKMYECYIGELSIDDAARFMKNTEEVADDFAARKIREIQKKDLIRKSYIPPSMYKNVPITQIKSMVNNYIEQMKSKNITTPDKVSEYFYNMVKSNL
jgi:hypothetical protein